MRLDAGRLHSGRALHASAGLKGKARGRVLSRLPLLTLHRASDTTDRRLSGAGDEAATIEVRIKDELPLAVFFLLVEFVNAFFGAGASDTDDGTASEHLALVIVRSRTRHLADQDSGLTRICALILRGVALLSGRRAVETCVL